MKTFLGLMAAFLFCESNAQELYQPADLTAENVFTSDIEGPRVDKQGNLFVVNFQKNGTIGQVHADGKAELYVTLPEGSTANAIQFDKKENMLLADWTGHNILKVDKKSKKVSVFVHNDRFSQPNDICINKQGQLFASDPNWKQSTGQLWRIEPNGKMTLLAENMGTVNGIELSPDEKILYVNESVQKKVWAFDVDASGNIRGKRLFFEFADFGLDGMKCDHEGNLYVTRHGKGTVVILSPQGKQLKEIELKGKKPSNLAFGGKDGKTCFVTLQDRGAIETFRAETAGKGL